MWAGWILPSWISLASARFATSRRTEFETGNCHCLRCVIYNYVDACSLLKGMDIPAISTDNSALHFFGGNVNHRGGNLGNMLGSNSLNRGGDDLSRAVLRLPRGLHIQPDE